MTNECSNNETPRDATAHKDDPPPEGLMASVLGFNEIGSEAQRDRGHVPTASTLKISGGSSVNLWTSEGIGHATGAPC